MIRLYANGTDAWIVVADVKSYAGPSVPPQFVNDAVVTAWIEDMETPANILPNSQVTLAFTGNDGEFYGEFPNTIPLNAGDEVFVRSLVKHPSGAQVSLKAATVVQDYTGSN